MEPFTELIPILDKAGTIALLIAVLLGGIRQWWVFGHHYQEMKADRDQWREIALSGHTLNKRAINVLTSTVQSQ